MVSNRMIATVFLTTVMVARLTGQVANHAFEPGNVPQRTDPSVANKLSPEQRGDVYMARKMFREAIDAYREGPPSSPIVANKIGIAYHQLGDFAAARRNYEHAIK